MSFNPVLIAVCVLLGVFATPRAVKADGPRVATIELHGMVNDEMASFVKDQLDSAWREGYSGVILDIDMDSGTDGAAQAIKSAILSRSASIPIAAFVHDHALGPGSLIPVCCKVIAMSDGAVIGGSQGSTDKLDFKAAAETTGRNPAIATSFVSTDQPWPNLSVMTVGTPMTLTTKQAQSVGYADVVANDFPPILAKMGLANAAVSTVHYDFWTATARWISQPWATILLLAIGLALVIVEMMTLHSWGLAGLIGGLLVLIIFAAHIAVGNGSWIGIILVLVGLAFLLFETHILPGHGVSAIVGIILVAIGMFLALGGPQGGGLTALGSSFITAIAIVVAFFLYLPKSRVWARMGMPGRQTAGAGYVASDDYTGYLGKVGTASSLLRPSGTAEIDGIKIPVVSEGEFIPAGSSIQVVVVQGNRIVVRRA